MQFKKPSCLKLYFYTAHNRVSVEQKLFPSQVCVAAHNGSPYARLQVRHKDVHTSFPLTFSYLFYNPNTISYGHKEKTIFLYDHKK